MTDASVQRKGIENDVLGRENAGLLASVSELKHKNSTLKRDLQTIRAQWKEYAVENRRLRDQLAAKKEEMVKLEGDAEEVVKLKEALRESDAVAQKLTDRYRTTVGVVFDSIFFQRKLASMKSRHLTQTPNSQNAELETQNNELERQVT